MSLTYAFIALVSIGNSMHSYDEYVFLNLYRTEVRSYIMDGVTGETRHGYLNRSGDFVSEGVAQDKSKNKHEHYMHWADVYNIAWCRDELLYEFKSGMLVPGKVAFVKLRTLINE